MFIAKTLSFYKDMNVRRALLEQARHKEIAVKYTNHFGKRPEAIFNEGDILEFAKQKATSFHASEELWDNPLDIKTGMNQKDIQQYRTGWDLILDIDCPYWPLSKLITHLFIKALQAHDIKAVTCKFSGNKGFHIAVPFESFPKTFQGEPTQDLFPEAPRRIAYYLLDYLINHYFEEQGDNFVFDQHYKINKEKLLKAVGKEKEQEEHIVTLFCYACGNSEKTNQPKNVPLCPVCGNLMKEEHTKKKQQGFDPLTIIEVDTILIAHRHLYRMPYSFHEKSQLVSVPIAIERVLKFSKKEASPENVDMTQPFLDRSVATAGEANKLLIAAYDFEPQIKEEELPKKTYDIPTEAIPEQFFPPCIINMLKGMKDGKKRTLFTLINFLRGCGWHHDDIEKELRAWNERNDEQLREVIIKGRLRYEKTRKESLPPHNCKRYYQDMTVCAPDNFCAKIKNPLQYAKMKAERASGTKRTKLTDEQKEMRRKHREALKKS